METAKHTPGQLIRLQRGNIRKLRVERKLLKVQRDVLLVAAEAAIWDYQTLSGRGDNEPAALDESTIKQLRAAIARAKVGE